MDDSGQGVVDVEDSGGHDVCVRILVLVSVRVRVIWPRDCDALVGSSDNDETMVGKDSVLASELLLPPELGALAPLDVVVQPGPVSRAVAQAHTELAPAMTDGRAEAGHAEATQGTRICDRLLCAAGLHWQAKSSTRHPTWGTKELKQPWAQLGTAEMAMGAQFLFVGAVHGGCVIEVDEPVVDAGSEGEVEVFDDEAPEEEAEPEDAEALDDVAPEEDADPVEADVEVADKEQGVVGLALTQAHKAETELITCRPVVMPQPDETQLNAALQPTWLAAELMHGLAQTGTASALFWQGEAVMQEDGGCEVDDVDDWVLVEEEEDEEDVDDWGSLGEVEDEEDVDDCELVEEDEEEDDWGLLEEEEDEDEDDEEDDEEDVVD
ncbi:hypothetical protein CDD81_4031 [Ophiocordyceps australis]|uniref:Uncharacterized protein n=1 Tax=Ophiocordyceps australis TaxID=1399860 RepID=A0A2C5XAJ7_9HYPO|nr:hypothetical protein CDD81_4031 [Ophiocordyceps australis]